MQRVDRILAQAIDTGTVPGVVAMAATDAGVAYAGAFGVRTADGAPMGLDSVVWLASMTKPITSIAALQLVEQGRIGLDDPVGEVVPELAVIQVLVGFDASGAPRLRPPIRPITLRQLLTHTSGFGYRFCHAEHRRYCELTGVPDLSEGKKAGLMTPLVDDPGARWQYSISIDWVGQLIERVSGETLDDYFRAHVLGPLGMDETGFVLSPRIRARFVDLQIRQDDGSFRPIPFEDPPVPEFHAGGGDLFSTGPDYLRFLRMLLGGGQLEGTRIVSAETVAELGRNQIGDLTAGVITTTDATFSADVEFFPGMTKRWGLASLITPDPAPTGRAAGGLSWAGIMNTYFWVDPLQQVAGVMLTQTLPFGDPAVLKLFEQFETAIYAACGALAQPSAIP